MAFLFSVVNFDDFLIKFDGQNMIAKCYDGLKKMIKKLKLRNEEVMLELFYKILLFMSFIEENINDIDSNNLKWDYIHGSYEHSYSEHEAPVEN